MLLDMDTGSLYKPLMVRRILNSSSPVHQQSTHAFSSRSTIIQFSTMGFQLVTVLAALAGCALAQYGGGPGYGGYAGAGGFGGPGYAGPAYGGHGYAGHGHGYAAAPVLKAAVPVVAKAVDYDAYPSYKYSYGVSDALTGDQKSASETRDGDRVTGHYSLVEADGSVRTVHYTADHHNGFNAVVEKTPAVHKAVVAAPVVAKAVVPAYAHAPYAPEPLGYGGHGHGYAAPVEVAPVVKATPVLKAVGGPAYGYAGHGHAGGYSSSFNSGPHGGYGYAQQVSHAHGVTHYSPAVAAAPVYASHGHGYAHQGYAEPGYGHSGYASY